jgi:hypothetical protein
MKNSVFVLPEHLLYYLRLHSRIVNQKHPKEDGDDNISIYSDPVFETLLLHLIYKGIEQEHYRNACPMEYSSHVFLHYVDANGPHKDFAFDKRPKTHLVSQGTR